MANAATDPIKHIVVLMLENRSFDHLLGSMKSWLPEVDGIDPAAPGVNRDKDGRSYKQEPRALFTMSADPKHEFINVQNQLEGPPPNGGFVKEFLRAYPGEVTGAQQVMDYFDRSNATKNRLPALHTLAEQFLICDRWFSSVPGPTWPNRFFVHSGTSKGWVDMPHWFKHWHLYDQTTVYDRLNERGVPWAIYRGDFPQSLLLVHQLQRRNLFRYRRMKCFFTDVNDEASFPAYCFIEPSYFGADQNDQHPPSNVLAGDKLIAAVYNALRGNEALWQSTLFVVLYDEHGGLYDHVDPRPPNTPAATPPDGAHGDSFTFDRYGVRVPAMLISPYVPPGVSHTLFDHTSLLRYMQEKWALGPLGDRTAAANSLAPLISGPPRTNVLAYVGWTETGPAPSAGPNDLQQDLLGMSRVLERNTITSPAAMFMRPIRAAAGPDGARSVAEERLEDFMAQQANAPDLDPALLDDSLEERTHEEQALEHIGTGSAFLFAEPARSVVSGDLAVQEVVLTSQGPISEAAKAYMERTGIHPDALLAEARITIANVDLVWPLSDITSTAEERTQAWAYLADIEEQLQALIRDDLRNDAVKAIVIGATEGSLMLAVIIVNISISGAAAGGGGLLWFLKDYAEVREGLTKLSEDLRRGYAWIRERTQALRDRVRRRK